VKEYLLSSRLLRSAPSFHIMETEQRAPSLLHLLGHLDVVGAPGGYHARGRGELQGGGQRRVAA
jgi:hypothetical protein